jgi:gentisate 1,2-dioxygenase
MFSAPGWAVHHHASGPEEYVNELTIQDQPFHLALESLLWQEDLKRKPRLLGVQSGFDTNRPAQ